MKLINKLVGLAIAVIAFWFAYVWMFMPDKRQEIQDWWYGTSVDCNQLHDQITSHQRCKRNDDCELEHSESQRAEKLEAQYARYCGRP